MIDFFNEDIQHPQIETSAYTAWISKTIRRFSKDEGDISIIFCSDRYLIEINREYLNHDYFTDIITFNYNEGEFISGDIFISLDTVKLNAAEYKVSFEDELRRVIIHGVLHLLGYDDQTESQKQTMRLKEEEAMNFFDS